MNPSSVTPLGISTPATLRMVGYQSDICIIPSYTEPGLPGARGPLIKPATFVPYQNQQHKVSSKLENEFYTDNRFSTKYAIISDHNTSCTILTSKFQSSSLVHLHYLDVHVHVTHSADPIIYRVD